MHEITESTLQTIAGTIEALLIEQRESIAFAYKKIPDGIKVSISVNLDPTSQGVCVTYNLSFPLQPTPEPPEKCKVTKWETINDSAPLFDTAVVVTHEKVKAMLSGDKVYKTEGK